MKLSNLKTNVAAVEGGAWIKDMPGWEGLELHVRGSGCSAARALRSKLISAIPASRLARGQVTPAETLAIDAQVLHETILLDWRGLTGDDDQPIPYSSEFAFELLSEPQWEAFRGIVLTASQLVSALEDEAEKAAAKN